MKGKGWFVGFWVVMMSYVVLGVAFVFMPRQLVVQAPPAQYMILKEECSTCKALEDLILPPSPQKQDPSLYGEYETF